MIIHIKCVIPALTRGLTPHGCGGSQFVDSPGQVPNLPSSKSDPAYLLPLLRFIANSYAFLFFLWKWPVLR